MAVILLKLIFSVLTTLSNIITRLIFTTTAQIVVQLLLALKVPGDAGLHVLEQVKNIIRTLVEYLMEFVIEVTWTILSSLFDVVKEGVLNSSSGLTGAVVGLLEKSKDSLVDLVQDVPEVLDAFTEMIGKIVADLLNNCNDAISYVTENVLSS